MRRAGRRTRRAGRRSGRAARLPAGDVDVHGARRLGYRRRLAQIGFFTPEGQGYAETPENSYDAGDVLANCQYNTGTCASQWNNETVPINASHAGGTQIFVGAECVAPIEGDDYCQRPGDPVDAADGVDAQTDLYAAVIEPANDATPRASGFAGGLLVPNASGVQDLLFTAQDPNGPGIDNVTVTMRRGGLRPDPRHQRGPVPKRRDRSLRRARVPLPSALPPDSGAQHPRQHRPVRRWGEPADRHRNRCGRQHRHRLQPDDHNGAAEPPTARRALVRRCPRPPTARRAWRRCDGARGS